jgi:hypothetical protein
MACDHPSNGPKAAPEVIRAQQALLHTQPRHGAHSIRKAVGDEQPPDRVASELEAAKTGPPRPAPHRSRSPCPAAPTAKPARRRSQPSRTRTPAARPTQTEATPTHHLHTHTPQSCHLSSRAQATSPHYSHRPSEPKPLHSRDPAAHKPPNPMSEPAAASTRGQSKRDHPRSPAKGHTDGQHERPNPQAARRHAPASWRTPSPRAKTSYRFQKCPTCAATREVMTGSGAIDSDWVCPLSAPIIASTLAASAPGS